MVLLNFVPEFQHRQVYQLTNTAPADVSVVMESILTFRSQIFLVTELLHTKNPPRYDQLTTDAM